MRIMSLEPLVVQKLAPNQGGPEETKDTGRPLQTGQWHLQETKWLTSKAGLGCKTCRPLCPATRISGVYRGLIWGQSRTWPHLNTSLPSQGHVLGAVPTVGAVGRTYVPKTGKEVRSLQLPRSAHWSLRVTSSPWPPLTATSSAVHRFSPMLLTLSKQSLIAPLPAPVSGYLALWPQVNVRYYRFHHTRGMFRALCWVK